MGHGQTLQLISKLRPKKQQDAQAAAVYAHPPAIVAHCSALLQALLERTEQSLRSMGHAHAAQRKLLGLDQTETAAPNQQTRPLQQARCL
jgi:hypothetical protein